LLAYTGARITHQAMPSFAELPLTERLRQVPQVGKITWIGLRPAPSASMLVVPEVEAIEQRGLAGDRAALGRIGSKRQVTLVQAEHLPVLAALVGTERVEPTQLRRNLIVSSINLIALAKLRFRIGERVVLQGTGACAPCGLMEQTLGPGGFQAMRGHGGITAQIISGGVIRLGDRVWVEGAA